MLSFIRSDLTQVSTYKADPEGSEDQAAVVDRLDTNECPYDLPIQVKAKLMAQYQNQIEANRYPNGDHLHVKRAIANYVNEAVPGFDSSWISVGNGSDELIRSVLMATCLGGEGSILVAQPTFSMYGILAKTLGIPVVTINRLESFEMDLSQAREAVAQSKSPPIRVVFVVHPNSPTANPLTDAEVQWLERLPENILVVVDEAYFEFSQCTMLSRVLARPNWLVFRTFSKAFRLAAHRVGYAIAHPEVTATLEKMRLPYNLTAVSLAAAEVAMQHRETLLAILPEIMAERDQLLKQLSSLPQLQIWPSAANFIYARGESMQVSEQIYLAMKKQGSSIRFTGGGLRITVGTSEENRRTWERLVQTVANFQPLVAVGEHR
ncbi:MAG: histidinol-phosphate transaminase [Cyanobacteria bacterium P01_F01_bin.42]